MATNNGTLGVQNDTHTYSSSKSNINISIAISKGSITVKSGVISRQAAHIAKIAATRTDSLIIPSRIELKINKVIKVNRICV